MNGFFLGGMAEGARNRELLDLQSREVDIKADSLRSAYDKAVTTQVDRAIASNEAGISEVINQARKANVPPEKIRAMVAPLVQSFQRVAAATGRDISPVLQQFDVLAGVPGAAEGEAAPQTEIGKLRADLSRGFINQAEFSDRVARLTREPAEANIVEQIRRKLASGQALTPGEQRVYDDALMRDPVARFMAGALNQPAPAAAPARPAIPAPKADPLGVR